MTVVTLSNRQWLGVVIVFILRRHLGSMQNHNLQIDLYSAISNLKLLCCTSKINTEKVCVLVPFAPTVEAVRTLTSKPFHNFAA
jgi:hypothetical protein